MKLTIAAVQRSHGRDSFSEICFQASKLNIATNSWLWRMLELIAKDASVTPCHTSQIRSLMSAIRLYRLDRAIRKYLNMMPEQIDARQMYRLFELCESDVEVKSLHGKFQAFVYRYAARIPFNEEISRKSVCFRSKKHKRKGHSPLLSDLSDLSDVISDVPIGALNVSSIADARRKLKIRAQSDLQKIRAACIQDLECCASVRKHAQHISEACTDEGKIAIAWKAMRASKTAIDIIKSVAITPEEILPLVLVNLSRHPNFIARFNGSYIVPMSGQLHEILFGTDSPFKSLGAFEIAHRALTEEIFSAFHLLQTYTGWNFSAILQMQAKEIRYFDGEVVEIQSFKDKTDDDTPVVVLDLREPGVRIALDILTWNFNRLRQLGIIASEDDFLGKMPSPRGTGVNFLQPKWPFSAFLERHGFSKYKLDQVRTQLLFIKTLEGGAIEAARLTGGHVSTRTTDGYVSNIIQDRISSCANLAFSRKLSAEIKYIYDNDGVDDVSIVLLAPIGDGTFCADIEHPPPELKTSDSICEAKSCHLGMGCRNRRIVIDDFRIEEIIRLNYYYRQSWLRCLNVNPERYEKSILPGLVFNEALLLALKNGPYSSRVALINQKISS